jgi:hypothetical protein
VVLELPAVALRREPGKRYAGAMQRALVQLMYVAALAGALGCGGNADTRPIDAGPVDGPFPTCELGRPLCGSFQGLTCCPEGEQCCPYNFESTACYSAAEPCPHVCGLAPCELDELCLQEFLPPATRVSESCVTACPTGTTQCGDDLCCGANARCDAENTCVPGEPSDGGVEPFDAGAALDATMFP